MLQATQITGFVIAVLVCSTTLSAQQLTAGVKPAAAAAASPQSQAQPLLTRLNQKLPAWLGVSGEYRFRVEGVQGIGFQADAQDAYGLGRLRLNLRVIPTRWLRFHVQAQDAQAMWRNAKPDAPPFEDRSHHTDDRRARVACRRDLHSTVPASAKPRRGFPPPAVLSVTQPRH